jgi:hypothetical protein
LEQGTNAGRLLPIGLSKNDRMLGPRAVEAFGPHVSDERTRVRPEETWAGIAPRPPDR